MALSSRGQRSHDYPNFHFDWGLKALGNLYDKNTNPEIIVTSGVGAALDLLAHAFADEGDTFLCPAPHYSVIRPDVGVRCGVKCFPIQLPHKDTESSRAFKITRALLEEGLARATNEGHKVKGIVIVNPNNPTGDVYSEEEMLDIINFSARHDIHLISDEIYALSVFETDVKFRSILNFDLPKPNLVHMLWGFSKDFCLAGYRYGVIYTTHPQVTLSARHLSYLAAVPGIIQQKLCSLIEDKEWIDSFLLTNLARMKESYDYCSSRLKAMGVHVHKSSAAFFVWADFSQFLNPMTKEAEIEFFKTLYFIGVYFTPGSKMSFAQPGWFRINFTQKREHIDIALDRLENILKTLNK